MSGIPHERAVCRWLDNQAAKQLDAIVPKDADSLKAFQDTFGGAWQVVFDQGIPAQVDYQAMGEIEKDGIVISKGLVRDPARGAELPLLTVRKNGSDANTIVIWSSGSGKSIAFDDQGRPTSLMTKLLSGGATVMLADLLHQGEFNKASDDSTTQRLIKDERSYSAFTFGYNRPLVADRSADLLSIVAHAINRKPNDVRILGTDGSASWVAPAAALAGSAVARVAVDTGGFRFGDVRSYRDANFIPGAVKYGDLPVLSSAAGAASLDHRRRIRPAGHRHANLYRCQRHRRGSFEHVQDNR